MDQEAMNDLARYVNLQDAMYRLRGNEKIYQILLTSFMDSPYMDELLADIERNDLDTAAKTAHKIKGVTANLSLDEVYALVVLLELQLKSGSEYQGTLEKLGSAMQKTTEYIKAMLNDWPVINN